MSSIQSGKNDVSLTFPDSFTIVYETYIVLRRKLPNIFGQDTNPNLLSDVVYLIYFNSVLFDYIIPLLSTLATLDVFVLYK